MGLIDEIYPKFSKKSVILDTKPFILYVIGTINPARVETFKPTKEFSMSDFRKLSDFLSSFNTIYVTPYILSEFSHFTLERRDLSNREKEKIAHLIISLNEKKSFLEDSPILDNVFSNRYIAIVGSSDTSLLEVSAGSKVPILTSDGVLADFARKEGKIAFKFLPTVGIVPY